MTEPPRAARRDWHRELCQLGPVEAVTEPTPAAAIGAATDDLTAWMTEWDWLTDLDGKSLPADWVRKVSRAASEIVLAAAGPLIAEQATAAAGQADTSRILRAFALATCDPTISLEAGDRMRRAFGRALGDLLDREQG